MARVPAPIEQLCDIYIDESSQTQNKYLIIGGLILHKLDVAGFDSAMATLRLPQLPAQEMKWAKVSKAKLPAYERVVKGFWHNPQMRDALFHAVVIDTSLQDHRLYNQGNQEVGFNKEIYQLATKFARLHGGLFHLYLDYRNTDQKPDDLRLILNRGRAKNGDKRDWPFRRCHFRNSKECQHLQLVDVFIGALGFHLNKHCEAMHASPAKLSLSRLMLDLAGIRNPFVDTAITGKFTVWHRKLRPSPKTGVP